MMEEEEFVIVTYTIIRSIISSKKNVFHISQNDQLEREIRRYGVSTGPAFNFGDRKQLSGLLKWLLGLKRFSMY